MGYSDKEIRIKNTAHAFNISLFAEDNRYFMYYETKVEKLSPNDLVEKGMMIFPNGTIWQQLFEVFEYSRPINDKQWERQNLIRQPQIRLQYLRENMVSSYVFYHFQLQEERPKLMNNKYGMIFLLGNLLVMYGETPSETDNSIYPGKLITHNTPENWSELMNIHFAYDSDSHTIWKPINFIESSNFI
jgi:hypothetical protein